MAWKVQDIVSQRKEFVVLALHEEANVRQLCRRFGITAKTAYKWIGRFRAEGQAGLADRSRRPRASPRRTGTALEAAALTLRDEHPAWGGRKIRRRLQDQGLPDVPAASTITDILRRHGQIDLAEAAKRKAFERFEHAAPNDLWQMDFKGHFALEGGGRCHPLTVLDDHSRFAIGLRACTNETTETVRRTLTDWFRLYGLPRRMLMDNGSPWGNDAACRWTPLTLWLARLGVGVAHGRPFHPQTQGKDERFHRTLQVEVLRYETFADLAHVQRRFDPWRQVYNCERPHEALALATPASRYQPSPRVFPETLPPVQYGGLLSYQGRLWRIARAFRAQSVALRPTAVEGELDVFFCAQRVGRIDLRRGEASVTSGDHEDLDEERTRDLDGRR